jgi:hypothetical protein
MFAGGEDATSLIEVVAIGRGDVHDGDGRIVEHFLQIRVGLWQIKTIGGRSRFFARRTQDSRDMNSCATKPLDMDRANESSSHNGCRKVFHAPVLSQARPARK